MPPTMPIRIKNVVDIDIELQYVTGQVAADTVIIPNPGSKARIVVCSFVIQNESGNATTMIFRNGLTPVWRCFGQNQGDGLAMVFSNGMEWRLSPNSPLIMDLSGANNCGYSVQYFIEAA